MTAKHKINVEMEAARAFTAQSPIFDTLYGKDVIIRYKRERVRKHVEPFLCPGSTILELNAGTGEDAIYFAGKGHRVHATDISTGMLAQLKEKVQNTGMTASITYEQCSFTQLEYLKHKGPYDYIFSNFAGLNCTGELDKVLLSLQTLLKPGGTITLVILPPFCLWETLLLFKGRFRYAFRRFFAKNGAPASIEGNRFTCWYYHPGYVSSCLQNSFELLDLEGLCTIVPPSYLVGFAEKYPGILHWLMKKEDRFSRSWPWKNMGDYYIISLTKK